MAETISGSHCTYPQRDGQAEWAWVAWINTGMVDPPKVVTNPRTNRARCSLTLLMWQMPLLLHQTSHAGKGVELHWTLGAGTLIVGVLAGNWAACRGIFVSSVSNRSHSRSARYCAEVSWSYGQTWRESTQAVQKDRASAVGKLCVSYDTCFC